MSRNAEATSLPLLFLDVDGPLIPFGASTPYPEFRPHTGQPDGNPLLRRIDPDIGASLLSLSCELVWATSWRAEANEVVAPLLGLPKLPVVEWPETDVEPSSRLHWKTPTILDWAAGRPFIWIDDELTEADRHWVDSQYSGRSLLHQVDHRRGLRAEDFAVLCAWLRED